MKDVNELYFSSVTTKFEQGRDLYRQHHRRLDCDHDVQRALSRLDDCISGLQQQMASMTMFSQCAECGQKEAGGCCSAFMAGETDALLILINLLLSVEVGFQRNDGFECVYLGREGCIFKAKPMFCLNYNCSAIYAMNPSTEIAALDKTAGEVLRQQYEVELLLLRRLGIR